MGKTKEPKKELKISIPEMKRMTFPVEVQGTSQLIVHQFSDKGRKQILDKQLGKANKGREKKNPISDFVHALYLMNGFQPEEMVEKLEKANVQPGMDVAKHFKGIKLGFPAAGFKNAAVAACRNVDGIPMTIARGAFFVLEEWNGMVEIEYDQLIIREDVVRLQGRGKPADIRFRPGFNDWTAKLKVICNPLALSPEQICNLIDISGFSVGVGDWRPSCNGSYGMFQLKR